MMMMMICLNIYLIKIPPKIAIYRCHKNYYQELFFHDLIVDLQKIRPGDYTSYINTFTSVLNIHAPVKKKVLRGNNKPFVNQKLRNAISTRSRLRKIANKTGIY